MSDSSTGHRPSVPNLEMARRMVRTKIGTINEIQSVKEATDADIDWYLAMHGNKHRIQSR